MCPRENKQPEYIKTIRKQTRSRLVLHVKVHPDFAHVKLKSVILLALLGLGQVAYSKYLISIHWIFNTAFIIL